MSGLEKSRSKEIRPYLIVPNIVNVIFFSIMAYLLFAYGGPWIDRFTDFGPAAVDLPGWLDWLEAMVNWVLGLVESIFTFVVWVLAIALFLMILATTFTIITTLLISPFLAVLAEKVESSMRPIDYPSFTVKEILARSFKREIHKTIYILIRLLLLAVATFLLSFIPVINLLVPIIWFFYNAWIKAIEFTDYAADNNGVEFKQSLAILKANRMSAIGFGSVAYVATMIPIVNWFSLPVAVTGATEYWIKEVDSKSKEETH